MHPIEDDQVVNSTNTRAFRYLFWSFIFTFIDFAFKINGVGIDIFPDIVGYVCLAFGLNLLSSRFPEYRILVGCATLLAVYSVFDLVGIERKVSFNQFDLREYVFSIWGPLSLVATLIHFFIIWRVCELIIRMAHVTHHPALAASADIRRKVYLVLTFSFAIPTILLLISIKLALMTLTFIALCGFIVTLLLMGLMRRAEKMCQGLPA
jgi:hypothetical protein